MIPLHRPSIRRKAMNSVLSCLVSDHIGPGPLNHELCSSMARYLSLYGGVAFSSYTRAVHCALDFLELEAGDRIILSAFSPSVYFDLLKAKGLQALVTDVDLESGLMQKLEVERLMSLSPKAIIFHYTLGFVPESGDIFSLGIPVLEDISQALGSSLGDLPCGYRGNVTVLAMEADGIVTCGGGGLVLARDKNDFKSLKRIADGYPENVLLPDMNAALGISQMKEVDAFLNRRREIEKIFKAAFMRSRHECLVQKGEGTNTPFGFAVFVRDNVKRVRQYAGRKNIETKAAFAGSYVSCMGPEEQRKSCVNGCSSAGNLLLRCLQFPLYPSLKQRDVQLIAKVLASLP